MAKEGQQELNITVIHCRRGRARKSDPCSVANCGREHTKLCDFPLKGAKEGQTCDALLCDAHAHALDERHDYCPAHARFAERQP